VLHGTADTLVPPRASEAFAARGNVTSRVHDGLWHETHNEPGHERVVAEIAAWLGARRPIAGAVGV
jgi:alpha-beta hydrolase superfamily lysophospholipase